MTYRCKPGSLLNQKLEQYKQNILIETMREFNGNQVRAAKHLGISRTTLRFLLKEMDYSKIKILSQITTHGKNVYLVAAKTPVTESTLLKFCDAPFGAPFGGKVLKIGSDRYSVEVFTD